MWIYFSLAIKFYAYLSIIFNHFFVYVSHYSQWNSVHLSAIFALANHVIVLTQSELPWPIPINSMELYVAHRCTSRIYFDKAKKNIYMCVSGYMKFKNRDFLVGFFLFC